MNSYYIIPLIDYDAQAEKVLGIISYEYQKRRPSPDFWE